MYTADPEVDKDIKVLSDCLLCVYVLFLLAKVKAACATTNCGFECRCLVSSLTSL